MNKNVTTSNKFDPDQIIISAWKDSDTLGKAKIIKKLGVSR